MKLESLLISKLEEYLKNKNEFLNTIYTNLYISLKFRS